ncbi:MAG: hypothetical protein AB2A00_30175 [Myxococcota bacterium]
MSKTNVLDAMRAVPGGGAHSPDLLRELMVADVQRHVASLPGLTAEQRQALLAEALGGRQQSQIPVESDVELRGTALLQAAFGAPARRHGAGVGG